MFKLNLAVKLNLQRKDKTGRHVLRLRTTINKKVSYIPLGISLFENQWDDKAQKVVNHPNKSELNLIIREKINAVEKSYLIEGITGQSVKTKDFIIFIQRSMDKENLAPVTMKNKLSEFEKLKSFRPTISTSEINPDLLKEYENFCRSRGNIDTTIWNSIKFVKIYINKGISEGLIKPEQMRGYKNIKYVNPEREYLTAEQLEKLEKLALSDAPAEYICAANWFLFCCYSGLRYSDAVKFKLEDIKDGRIILRTQKSGSDISIIVHPKLKKVLKRLKGTLTTNQNYNRNLKAIAFLTGLPPLTSHIARHTFAVQYLDRGGSMEVLSHLLGHSNLKTTKIYGKITDKRVDSEVLKVWG